MRNGEYIRGEEGSHSIGITARFCIEAKQNKLKSAQMGRPVYDDVEYVEVMHHGDKNSILKYPVKDIHRNRWPKEYEAFRKGQDVQVEGTRLEQWPPISKSEIATLKAMGIYTVEQLSEMKDDAITRYGMGGRKLVNTAKAYLKAAQSGSGITQLQAENEKLQARIASLEAQLGERQESQPVKSEPEAAKTLDEMSMSELRELAPDFKTTKKQELIDHIRLQEEGDSTPEEFMSI